MLFTDRVFVGINTTGGHKPFAYAAIDDQRALIAQGEGELDDIMAFLGSQREAVVAINAPASVNHGLVRARMQAAALTKKIQLRGADMREAEYDLRQRGINISKTASRPDLCPSWMRLGFTFYQKLAENGFLPYPQEKAPWQWLETHPHAIYTALLGHQPWARATLEGRLQRQLVLVDQGLRLPDPMDFFEEVTRYRILQGQLPFEMIYPANQLDLLAAALTAWKAIHAPEEMSAIGDPQESLIYLPAPDLKKHYD